jgi:molybdopterin synthase catalytic subunit
MTLHVELTRQPLESAPLRLSPDAAQVGALVEFRGLVRAEENGRPILALDYEAYEPMARAEMRRILVELGRAHECLAAGVVHRLGRIGAGEAAIHVQAMARHRAEAFALVSQFLDRLKRDVPIWKSGAAPVASPNASAKQ